MARTSARPSMWLRLRETGSATGAGRCRPTAATRKNTCLCRGPAADGRSKLGIAFEIARALQHVDRYLFELERQSSVGGLARELDQLMRTRAEISDQFLVHAAAGPMSGLG